jgi:hypothetical protein
MNMEPMKGITFSPPVVIEMPHGEPEWTLSFGGSNPEYDEQCFEFPEETCFALSNACKEAVKTVLRHPSLLQHFGLRVDGKRMDTWLRLWYLNKQEFPTKEEWQSIIFDRLTTTPEEKE